MKKDLPVYLITKIFIISNKQNRYTMYDEYKNTCYNDLILTGTDWLQ